MSQWLNSEVAGQKTERLSNIGQSWENMQGQLIIFCGLVTLSFSHITQLIHCYENIDYSSFKMMHTTDVWKWQSHLVASVLSGPRCQSLVNSLYEGFTRLFTHFWVIYFGSYHLHTLSFVCNSVLLMSEFAKKLFKKRLDSIYNTATVSSVTGLNTAQYPCNLLVAFASQPIVSAQFKCETRGSCVIITWQTL